jgi:hypothetical protein
MRREQKLGVYTNKSVKSCYSDSYCAVCKSVCKWYCKDRFDDHPLDHTPWDSKQKLHQLGFGSLMPGKKFVVFNKRYHTNKWYPLRSARDHDRNIKKQKKENFNAEIEYFNELTRIEMGHKKYFKDYN